MVSIRMTFQAMAELEIDISNHTLDLIDVELLNNATFVVTLCGDAADKCPTTPPHVRYEHWGFEDPAKATGTDEERWTIIQNVRDQIGRRIEKFITEEL